MRVALDDLLATAGLVGELGGAARAALGVALSGWSRCALLGYPNHRNPGDHAIWLGTKRILAKLGLEVSYECDWTNYSRDSLARAVDEGAVILFHGGASFGDVWPNSQGLRERVLADFVGARTIQLPQTIYFESDENLHRVRALLARHGNFELMVRERESLERAQRSLQVPVRLVPDLAFAVSPPMAQTLATTPIVWVARTDKESRGFEPPQGAAGVELCDWFPAPDDLLETAGSWDEVSRERLAFGCSVVRRGQIIVTDRLHAHLMALHLGVPSVVGDNNYGKIRAVYDTYTYRAPLARWAGSPAEALSIATEWLGGARDAIR